MDKICSSYDFNSLLINFSFMSRDYNLYHIFQN